MENKSGTIPFEFKVLFWDVNFEQLDTQAHKHHILGRLMNLGGMDAFRWIIKTYSREECCEFFKSKGKYALDRRSWNFWNMIINWDEIWIQH